MKAPRSPRGEGRKVGREINNRVDYNTRTKHLTDERPYVPSLYETRYWPIEETMIYGAFIEWSVLRPGHPTGSYILIRELDRARDLAYGYEDCSVNDSVTSDCFRLVDMRELNEEKHWTPLLDWKSCKLNDAIEIVRRKLNELGPMSDALFG